MGCKKRCHTDYILIMSTWLHESARSSSRSQDSGVCVCVCCHGRCINLCASQKCTRPCARALVPPHVTADVAQSLSGVSTAEASTDLHKHSKESVAPPPPPPPHRHRLPSATPTHFCLISTLRPHDTASASYVFLSGTARCEELAGMTPVEREAGVDLSGARDGNDGRR